MRIGNPRLILDPYEWLPSYGESKVSFRSNGVDAILDIEYEKDTPGIDGFDFIRKMRRGIVFKYARLFIRTPFPGSSLFEFHGDSSKFNLGELTEFVDSELIDSDKDARYLALTSEILKMRHFSIQFLAENVAFHVLAESVFLTDEVLIS
jgi:hypothetical protein